MKELKFLKPDSLLTQLQTDIAVVVLAKISLKKELEKLIEKFKRTETLYDLTDYCQECTIKHNELCLHQLEAIVQLENLQLIQNEYIQKLLLALNFVDLEKESIAENFVCYQQAAEEAQQKYQEILAYTNKLKIRAANIVSQVSMIEATK